MQLQEAQLSGVRNLTDLKLSCSPGINIICGRNAAGKTAILEGIYLLSRASSFRTPRARDVIQYGRQTLTVTARIKLEKQKIIATGIEQGSQQTNIRYNGEKVKKRSEQAKNLPLVVITTESHRLIYGTPKERRHWLDWSLFHVEPDYMALWHNYHHALRQRNCLIRNRAAAGQFTVWEQQLVNYGQQIRLLRARYLDKLMLEVRRQDPALEAGIEIKLQSSPQHDEEMLQRYQQREGDFQAGHTRAGAHREDVLFQHQARQLGRAYSRGEGKRFVVLVLLAQASLHHAMTAIKPLLLIDDLPSELDENACRTVIGLIEQQQLQTFLTTTQDALPVTGQVEKRLFHVEQGRLLKVVE